MKKEIAIIDDDLEYIKIFKSFFLGVNTNVNIYSSEKAIDNYIGLIKYDMIFVDHSLSWGCGVEVINFLSEKLDTDFSLICSNIEHYSKENIFNIKIKGILHKYNKECIISWYYNTLNKKQVLLGTES